jgi:replicative DNA helicase
MGSAQLVQRILSAESELPMEKISRGKLEDHEMQQLYSKGINKLTKAPIYIDDTAQLNIFELRAKARRLVNKHKVGIIIIDYLQLMSGTNDRQANREQEISRISRDLKGLAKELQVPIIALSQLSRAVETRKESKIPQLSDLRESGAIEQDADMVLFLYRDEYYGIETDEMGQSNQGNALVKIAKHRNGSLDTIKLRSDLTIQRFFEENENYGNNWKRIPSNTDNSNDQARLYIQKGSKMNNGDFEEGFNETDQF